MPPEPKGTTEDSEFLSQYVGQTVFTSGGQAYEVRAVQSGSIKTYRLFPVEGGRQLSSGEMQGLDFIDSLSRVVRIGTAVGGGDYSVSTGGISEAALRRFMGISDSGGTTAGRTQFESERALDVAQTGLAEAQARLNEANTKLLELEAAGTTPISPFQKAQLELDRLRAENDVKTFLLGQIGAERRTLIQEKGAERGRQTELAGRDIFKFTANLRGRDIGSAPTPVDIFKQQGAEFINRPLPQVDPSAPLSELQAGLSALQKLEAPQGQGLFGLAHGGVIQQSTGALLSAPGRGVIQMERGSDGAFSQKQAFFVGENPDGTINDTTEILITGGGKVEVIPLSGGASHGLSIPDLNLGGFPDLLDFLRRSTGLTGSVAGAGTDVRAPVLQSEAGSLGAFQRAPGTILQGAQDFGQARSGPVFVVDERGQLRPFTNFDIFSQSGFNAGQVETIPFSQLSQFRTGEAISDTPFSFPERTGPLPEFQAFGEPLNTLQGFMDLARINPDFSRADAASLANRIGFLPSPFKIAQQIGIGGANLDPAEISGLLSLYELAGVPRETFFRQIQAATPTGRFSAGQRIGFQGARF